MLNDAISNDDETKMEDTIRILNNRTNELGVSEAVIYRVGNDSISINIPGIQDPILARELIGKYSITNVPLRNRKCAFNPIWQINHSALRRQKPIILRETCPHWRCHCQLKTRLSIRAITTQMDC